VGTTVTYFGRNDMSGREDQRAIEELGRHEQRFPGSPGNQDTGGTLDARRPWQKHWRRSRRDVAFPQPELLLVRGC